MDETIEATNANAKVCYTMQWNNQHKMINKRNLAEAIGEMSTNPLKGQETSRTPLSIAVNSARSDDALLLDEIKNFISEFEKMKAKQEQVESRITANEVFRETMIVNMHERMKAQDL